jgi:nitrate reductase delta subunit
VNAVYRALAALLDYPDERLQSHIDEVARAVTDADFGAARRLRPLLVHLARNDLYELQELYVDTFDRGRRTSLNLFEHVHGDSRDRGQAMVDLLAMYGEAGLAFDTEQLPDYLPAFLEYLSLLPAEQARGQLAEITHIVRAVGGVLLKRGSPYACSLDTLLYLAGEAPLKAASDGEDDTTPAALDAAWQDAPVDFLGAAAPCSSTPRPATQTIQVHRRTA